MKLKEETRTVAPRTVTSEQFLRLLMGGSLVDGRMGGMLVGKMSGDGNARIISEFRNGYVVKGGAGGGCFVVNRLSAAENMARLKAMNAGLTLDEEDAPLDGMWDTGQIIVTTAYPHDRMLWLEAGQVVVNQEAANKHLPELIQMNKVGNPYLMNDHCELFG